MMKNTYMTARSLFDTFFYIGMTAQEAFLQCMAQGVFSQEELEDLKAEINR